MVFSKKLSDQYIKLKNEGNELKQALINSQSNDKQQNTLDQNEIDKSRQKKTMKKEIDSKLMEDLKKQSIVDCLEQMPQI